MLPVVDSNFESNIPGLYIAGSLVGASCIRVSSNQGHRIAVRIADLSRSMPKRPVDVKDLIIVGTGPTGLNAGLTAKASGLDVLLIDQYFLAATVLGMPDGKVFDVNYKGNNDPPEGILWFESSPAPVLHAKWMDQVKSNNLRFLDNAPVTNILHDGGIFEVMTTHGSFKSRFVILCIGMSGAPRQLNVAGELELYGRKRLHYRFRGPGVTKDKEVLVIGGGNSAVEAVIGLAQENHVTLSYRQSEFGRLTPKNETALKDLSNKGFIHIMLGSRVLRFEGDEAHIQVNNETIVRKFDEHFVLIGFEPPVDLLKKIGVRMA